MVPIVYSPNYNFTAFGIERRHSFDSVKYRRIHNWLIRQGLRKAGDFVSPSLIAKDDLLRVHTSEYLHLLRDRRVLAQILEVPALQYLPAWFIDWRVLRPMRWATGGTVLACRLALQRGLAINLGGGYHHASGKRGGGFCIYADAPLALLLLKQEHQVQSVLVVDTDAHQGDGTADAIRDWPWAYILDLYEDKLFPRRKAEEDMPVPLPSLIEGTTYLELLHEHLPMALNRFRPDFVLYNAGSDVLKTDPLAQLLLTVDEMAERDLYVVTEVRGRGIPLAMLLSGGYGPHSWEAHARSLEGIFARFN